MMRFDAIQENLPQYFHREVGINSFAIGRGQRHTLLDRSRNGQVRMATVNRRHILNLGGFVFGQDDGKYKL